MLLISNALLILARHRNPGGDGGPFSRSTGDFQLLVTAASARIAKFAVLADAVCGTVGQGVAKLVLFCNSVGI